MNVTFLPYFSLAATIGYVGSQHVVVCLFISIFCRITLYVSIFESAVAALMMKTINSVKALGILGM